MARYFSPAASCQRRPAAVFPEGFEPREPLAREWLHYQKTAEAWLANMDANEKEIRPLFAQTYGAENETRWWVYWRVSTWPARSCGASATARNGWSPITCPNK